MTVELNPLKLYAYDLTSKWGFRDGSYIYNGWIIPEQERWEIVRKRRYYDDKDLIRDFGWYYDAPDRIDDPGAMFHGERFWDAVLHSLVTHFLIPELDKNHTIGGLVWIGSSHNNTRIKSVDGKKVDWYGHEEIAFTPEYVEITFEQFREHLKEEFNYEF